MSQVLDHHDDHELEDHDRGLVFDITTMDRRRMLQLLGFGGLSASLFTIVGCGPAGATGTAGATADAAGCLGERDRGIRRELRRDPGGNGRALPGRRLQRTERPVRGRRGQERHPLEFRLVEHRRRGRPPRDQAHDPGRRRGLRAARRGGRLPLALRPRRGVLALLELGRRRELPARRPGGGRRAAS